MLSMDTNYFTEKVKNFTEQLAVYEDTKPLEETDAQTRAAYEEAVSSVEGYAKMLLLQEMYEDSSLASAAAQLKLPDRVLNISVSAEGTSEEVNAYELVETPIGCIDEYFYKQLLENRYNPISCLYKHLGVLIRGEHNMLAMQGCDFEILCKATLDGAQIQDVIGVYKMDSLLRGIDDFLSGTM